MIKNAFDKVEVQNLEFKNRFIRSAIWEGLATEEGEVTEKLIDFYKELSSGGVGTIITGFTNVVKYDKPAHCMIGAYDDKFIEGLKELVQEVHKNNCKIFLQLVVGGSQGRPGSSEKIVGPSAHINPVTKQEAIELSIDEILFLEEKFKEAAIRAKKAGFDGVEIHGAHGYLLSQFMNPLFNKREDLYGGSIENRSRFLIETYEKIREGVGEDYPVYVKTNCEDFIEGGATQDEMMWVCKELSKKNIDLIEISGGSVVSRRNEGVIRVGIKTIADEGYFQEFSTKLSSEIDTPVSIVGGIKSYEKVQEILENTNIKFISLARPLLCEPNLINKWKEKDYARAFCKSCNGCLNPKGSRCIFKVDKNSKTFENLVNSYKGEITGVALYDILGDKAQEEGYLETETLFRRLGKEEKGHGNMLGEFIHDEIFKLQLTENEIANLKNFSQNTLTNLKNFSMGEKKAGEENYPAYAKIAEEEGYGNIAKIFLALGPLEVKHSIELDKELKRISQ